MWKEIVIILLMIITGLACWQIAAIDKVSPADASFNLFVEILGTGVTILVLDQIWFAEERRRWQKIKDKVDYLLSDEISEIFTDFSSILIPLRAFVIKSEDPTKQIEELEQKTKEYQMAELNRLAQGNWEQVKQILIKEQHLLEGKYGGLFDTRYSNLNDIELKYSKFLEPSKLKPLIDLERLMKSLSSNIRVRLKLKTQPLGQPLIPSSEDKISYRVHEIMKTLNEMKNIGLLK